MRLHGTILPREIGVVRVTGLSRDKFAMGNIHGYVKKKGRNQPGHLNSLGFSIPKVRDPIRFLRLTTT